MSNIILFRKILLTFMRFAYVAYVYFHRLTQLGGQVGKTNF